MADTLAQAGRESLVLIDEMLTGTAPAEGAALAGTLLGLLADKGIRCVVTSHYGELKELAAQHPGMVNASVTFDEHRLVPTYRLLTGTPGASYAFPIARHHGLPEKMVSLARRQLADRPATADALLTQLHSQEQALTEREALLAKAERALASAETKLADRQKRLEALDWELRQQERGKIGKELEAARRRIAGVIKALQGANSLPLVAKVRKQLDDASRELLAPLPPPVGLDTAFPALEIEALHAGDQVLLRSLNRVAVVGKINARRKRVTVQLGSLAMEVDLAELSPPPPGSAARESPAHPTGAQNRAGAVRPAEKKGRKAADTKIGFLLSTEENTLDLRGQRLEVALDKTEAFCDLGVVKHVSPLLLIHGHGTGKLKAGIREWLTDNRYVAAFRPGEGGEGGDGVTVVALNL
jgi:DNA mismatch repair protein MutS2